MDGYLLFYFDQALITPLIRREWDYLMPMCSMESARKRWVKTNITIIGRAVIRQPAIMRVATFSGLVFVCRLARAATLDRS